MNIKAILSLISRLTQRERIVFYATLSVIGIFLLDRLILSPILSRIVFLGEAISTQEEEIRQSLIITAQEKKIAEESERYAFYVSQPLTEEKAITEFLKEVENIAKQSSVYLIDMKPSNKVQDSTATQYFVRLNFEAQMEQVINFFYHVSTYKQLIKISEFQLRPKTDGSSVISCDLTISKAVVIE